ncbi:MAG: GtrA family protein [Pseudomonadota bacterium]
MNVAGAPARRRARRLGRRPERRPGRPILFAGVGVACTAADLAVYAALAAAGAPLLGANAAAFATANLLGYLVNAAVTFRRPGAPLDLSVAAYVRYVGAYLFGFAVASATIAALAGPLGAVGAKFVAMALAAVSNYLLAARFVFREADPESS